MSKKDNICCCEEKKKSSLTKRVLQIIGLVAVVKGVCKLLHTYCNRKEKECDKNEKYLYFFFGSNKYVYPKDEKLQHMTVQANCNALELNFGEAEIKEDVIIHLNSNLSAVCIRVPNNIQVIMEDSTKLSTIANTVPVYVDDELPTINIKASGICNAISVKVIDD